MAQRVSPFQGFGPTPFWSRGLRPWLPQFRRSAAETGDTIMVLGMLPFHRLRVGWHGQTCLPVDRQTGSMGRFVCPHVIGVLHG